MKEEKNEVCGHAVALERPESVEEYNQLFWDNNGDKSVENPALEDAITQTKYHSTFGKIRAGVIDLCEKNHEGFKREKDKDGKPVESEKKCLARADQELGFEVVQGYFDDMAKANPIAPSGRTRGTGKPRKPAKMYVEAAQAIVAKATDENGNVNSDAIDKVVANLRTRLGESFPIDVSGDLTTEEGIESLAAAIGEYKRAENIADALM